MIAFDNFQGSSYDLTGGPFPVSKEIDLCNAVIKSATDHPPHAMGGMGHLIHDAAFRRVPLASAHSLLASVLSQIPAHLRVVGSEAEGSARPMVGTTDWAEFMQEKGLAVTGANLFAVVAEHYHLAADAQLVDADDAAILWWGFGANMVQAEGRGDGKPGGYTLGELRQGVAMARRCREKRDKLLFGEDDTAGGTCESHIRRLIRFKCSSLFCSGTFVL